MKNFKRILASVLAFTFVLAMAVVGISAGASQVAWYSAAVEYLDSLGISDIGSDGEGVLTRDEFVTWVAKIESHQTLESAWAKHEYVALTTFDDVEDSEHKGAIGYATNAGFIEGYGDRTFKPHQQIILGEAALILVRLMRYKAFLFTEGDDWGYNAMQTAQYYFNAFDAAFLENTETYDPAYALTKGEGAYLLYSILNGAAWEDGELDFDEEDDLRLAIDVLGNPTVDLGRPFANNATATIKQQFVVVNVPLIYGTQFMKVSRYDTTLAGATYESLFYTEDGELTNVLYNSDGMIDPEGVVTLQNLATGTYMVMDVADFEYIVKEAAGHGDEEDTTSVLLYAEQGSVLTISALKADREALTTNILDPEDCDVSIFTKVVINDALVADTYIGYGSLSAIDVNKKGTKVTGWKFATTDATLAAGATSTTAHTRLSNAQIAWTNITYNKRGAIVSAQLVVNGTTYDVVRNYTGKAGELKVFAPEEIMESTTKTIVSTVGYVGDTVYAGGVFSDAQKQILLLHGDYAAKFDGNTVAETFQLTEELPSFVSYELEVEGAFVTHTTFMLTSAFVKEGRLDQNYIDAATPLTAAEAHELILSPAQGESNVIFSDTDGDGLYDIAVVTESSRALYYGEVNGGEDGLNGKDGNLQPGSYGQFGLQDAFTKEVYDSFGNYILAAPGLKGNSIGGLVVDKTVTPQGAYGSGTDNWATSTPATNKVQLVVIGSNERLAAGVSEQNGYGPSAMHPYKTVDVATLTTAYIEQVSATKTVIDEVEYYVATVKVSENGDTVSKILYIPVTPVSQITLDVTLDGVTAPVTFNSGKSLLSFITNHDAAQEIGTVQDGAWMAGHTVKYVANADTNIVWCMVEGADVAAVSGFVAGVTKTSTSDKLNGDNTYKVTVVNSGASGIAAVTTNVAEADRTMEYLYEHIHLVENTPYVALAFGLDAWFVDDIPVAFYQVTKAADALYQAGAIKYASWNATATINATIGYVRGPLGIFNLNDFTMTGLYYAASTTEDDVPDQNTIYYMLKGADGYVDVTTPELEATKATNFVWVFHEGTVYYTFAATTAVDPVLDPATDYYTYDEENDEYTLVAAFAEGLRADVDYFTFALTTDEALDAEKTYYVLNNANAQYEAVAAPDVNDIATYFELTAVAADAEYDNTVDYRTEVFDYVLTADVELVAGKTYYVAGANPGEYEEVPEADLDVANIGDYFEFVVVGYAAATPEQKTVFDAEETYYERSEVDHDGAGDDDDEYSATQLYYIANDTVAVGADFDWAFKANVEYYDDTADAGVPDGTKLPFLKISPNPNRTGNNTTASENGKEFYPGTIISVTDYERHVRREWQGLVDVTAYVDADNFDTFAGELLTADEEPIANFDDSDEFYAYLFEYVDYDAGITSGDLFGAFNADDTDLTGVAWVATSTSSQIGVSTSTYTVTGSATAVWNYSEETYAVVNNLLAKGKLYNVPEAQANGIVDSEDLVYVTLTKATDYAGTHYTIDGLDAAAYTTAQTGSEVYDAYVVNRANSARELVGKLINAGGAIRGHWTADMYYGMYYDLFTTGAGDTSMWTEGGEVNAKNGTTFNNYYILGCVKDATVDRQPIWYDNEETIQRGYIDTYNMIIGKNPYYERTVAGGKITYTLKFASVESLGGVKGSFFYQMDTETGTVIRLYVMNSDKQRQSTDPNDEWHTNPGFYVDKDGYVWQVVGQPAYDATKLVSDVPTYDITEALQNDVQENISFADTKTHFGLAADALATKNLITISAVADKDVPAFYQVSLKTGQNDADVLTFGMTKNAKIVVITPVSNTATGTAPDNSNFKISVVSAADLVSGKKAIFATQYQYSGNAASCTQLSVFGEIVDTTAEPQQQEPQPPQPGEEDNWQASTIKGAVKVVYLNSDIDVIADAVLLDDSWVIRSTAPAIDVTTGLEVDNIKYVFGTYLTRTEIEAAQANLAAGGYFVINADNVVIARINENVAGVYGTETLSATVYAGTITAVTPDGKTTATMFGKSRDVSDKTFVYLYHDIDNADFGIGGTSVQVEVATMAEIIGGYATQQAIVNEGIGGAHLYDQGDIDDAQEQIDAKKAEAVSKYFNGTFWNVPNSPAYKYLAIQQVSGQHADVSFGFKYIVINDVVYVFVNSFTK